MFINITIDIRNAFKFWEDITLVKVNTNSPELLYLLKSSSFVFVNKNGSMTFPGGISSHS